jgi:hypothetical protein
MDKRLNTMNEIRESLRDQSSTMVTQGEHRLVLASIESLQSSIAKMISREDASVLLGRVEEDLRVLRESRAMLAGKASQNSVVFAIALAASGLVMGVVEIIMKRL